MEKTWTRKFRNAIGGILKGVRGQNSFLVHVPVAALVIALALWFRFDAVRMSVLLICIAIVLSCELINSSIERLAKSITTEHDQNIGDALDIASGAVLVCSVFAAVVGLLILLPPIWMRFFNWN